MSGASPAEKALAELRSHFAGTKPRTTALDQVKEAEARASLTPLQEVACRVDGVADGVIRREHRLTDTLLIVIDELRQRVTDLEEGMTGQ